METESQVEQFSETDLDESLHHVAVGPPYITTFCGVNIRGQSPRDIPRKPLCPICEALEKEFLA
jgi:rubrerythrin